MNMGIDRPSEYRPDSLRRAIDRLKSLQAGDAAVLEVAAYGRQAVPELRTILFKREPSGTFEIRTRAVDALAKLGACDVLIEFLGTARAIDDPIERVGEDAVISAAARALAQRNDTGLFELLVELARRPCLTGVIFALGASRRPEAIPLLAEALSEDASRLTAENALMSFGVTAQPALIEIADPSLRETSQSESRLRQRRSALRLLANMGVSPGTSHRLRNLMNDPDPRIATLACEICLRSGSARDKRNAVSRLLRLFCDAEWMDRDDVERCLTAHADAVKTAMAQSPRLDAHLAGNEAARALVRRICRLPG